MRWVTFHDSILGGITDVTYHKDKDEATRYFRSAYKHYFEINAPFKVQLPCRYGFPYRAFLGMSIRSFNKYWADLAKNQESNNAKQGQRKGRKR